MNRRLALLATAAICSPVAPRAQAAQPTLPDAATVPGGVAMIELGSAASRPSASYAGKPVMVLPQPQREGAWIALVGIALGVDPKQRQTLSVRSGEGARE